MDESEAAPPLKLQRITKQPENPFIDLVHHQEIAVVPSFTLESGVTLRNVPVAYTTRGTLSPTRDNVLVICHAVTGSADVSDWWGPLIGGSGRALDTTRFFIVCLNSLGSPYGSASPVTRRDGDPSSPRYGPDFPLTTIRDDVRIHRMILDDLGIRSIAAVVGGSMGGMLALEYAFLGKDYVRNVVPIATSSRHSAWGISWAEAQRQSIYSDPKYEDGYYSLDDPPKAGLGAARMAALLTYRSRDSFETRFGRNTPDPSRKLNINGSTQSGEPSDEPWAIHNDGHRNANQTRRLSAREAELCANAAVPSTTSDGSRSATTPASAVTTPNGTLVKRPPTYFSAQSYLRYQGEKFIKRFDSNCYIAMTRKLDTHDVSRGRVPAGMLTSNEDAIATALAQIEQPTLVIGIESDGLFTFQEQQHLASSIPHARLRSIDSPEGHDAFLLQFEQVNEHILAFFHEVLPEIMESAGTSDAADDAVQGSNVGEVTKSSTFGEAEVDDITAW